MPKAASKSKPAKKLNGNGAVTPADAYRDKWRWDKVFWATHCVDCYPGNCPYRVYVRDG